MNIFFFHTVNEISKHPCRTEELYLLSGKLVTGKNKNVSCGIKRWKQKVIDEDLLNLRKAHKFLQVETKFENSKVQHLIKFVKSS